MLDGLKMKKVQVEVWLCLFLSYFLIGLIIWAVSRRGQSSTVFRVPRGVRLKSPWNYVTHKSSFTITQVILAWTQI